MIKMYAEKEDVISQEAKEDKFPRENFDVLLFLRCCKHVEEISPKKGMSITRGKADGRVTDPISS